MTVEICLSLFLSERLLSQKERVANKGKEMQRDSNHITRPRGCPSMPLQEALSFGGFSLVCILGSLCCACRCFAMPLVPISEPARPMQ